MVQPSPPLVQLFSHTAVALHSSRQLRVQLVIRHPRELLHRSVQPPPGQSSVQSPPLTLLQLSSQLPPVHCCVHAPALTALQSSRQPAPAHVCEQPELALHASEQPGAPVVQVWAHVAVEHAQAPPSHAAAPPSANCTPVPGAVPHATSICAPTTTRAANQRGGRSVR